MYILIMHRAKDFSEYVRDGTTCTLVGNAVPEEQRVNVTEAERRKN